MRREVRIALGASVKFDASFQGKDGLVAASNVLLAFDSNARAVFGATGDVCLPTFSKVYDRHASIGDAVKLDVAAEYWRAQGKRGQRNEGLLKYGVHRGEQGDVTGSAIILTVFTCGNKFSTHRRRDCDGYNKSAPPWETRFSE